MRGRPDDAGPNEPPYGPSDLVDAVLALLEENGVPTEINDQIVRLIETWELSCDAYTEPDYGDPQESES